MLQNAIDTTTQASPQSPADLPYTLNPGTVSATPGQAGPASQAGTDVSKAAAQTQGLETAQTYAPAVTTPSESTMADVQATRIMGQDSPLMKLAAQQGLQRAGRRGLLNSSIAAGAAQAETAKAAVPLAQQNAAQLFSSEMANTEAQNRAAEFNAQAQNQAAQLKAQIDTAVAQGNAQAENAAKQQLAELQTRTDQFNAQLQTDVSLANAKSTNDARIQTMMANADLNKQWLTGVQAQDLQRIQGQYQQVISTNENAAKLYDSYFQSISSTLANKDIAPDRAAEYIAVQQSMLESGLRLLDQMNGLNLNTALPGVGVSGSGSAASIYPTTTAAPTTTRTTTGSTPVATAPSGGTAPATTTTSPQTNPLEWMFRS
jgi:hypothetical protein